MRCKLKSALGKKVTGAPFETGASIEYGWLLLGCTAGRAPVKLCGYVDVDEEQLKTFLRGEAVSVLKPGTRYELRAKSPTNYGRSLGMAWYHCAAMDREPDWGTAPLGFVESGGYFLIGQFVTPPAKQAPRSKKPSRHQIEPTTGEALNAEAPEA